MSAHGPHGDGADEGLPHFVDETLHAHLAETTARIARAIDEANAVPASQRPVRLVFRAGELHLSLPLTALREVVLPPASLARAPRSPAAVLGLINHRGRLICVVDLAHALPAEEFSALPPRSAPGADWSGGRILLFGHGRREIGLLVREIEGLASQPAPSPAGPLALDPQQLAETIAALGA